MANDQNQTPPLPPGYDTSVPYTANPVQPQLAAAPAPLQVTPDAQTVPPLPPGYSTSIPYTTDPAQPQTSQTKITPPTTSPAAPPVHTPPNPDDQRKWWEGPKEGGGFVLRDPALGDNPTLGEAAMHPMGKPVHVFSDMGQRINDFIAMHTPERTPDALLELVTGTVAWDAGFVNGVVEKLRQFSLSPVAIATLGLSRGLAAAKASAAVPQVAKSAIGLAEAGTSGLFAEQGVKGALTPRQPGESTPNMWDRRLTSAATALLGAAGATEGGKEAFKGISANKIVGRIASTVGIPQDFDMALTNLAKPSAKQYKAVQAQVANISEDLQSILNEARRKGTPMGSPHDFVVAGDQYFQNHENELQKQAGATKDSAIPVVPDIEKRISNRLDTFFDENKGLYGDDLQVREAKAKILEGILQTRNGLEMQQPNLFESENIRRRLGRQGAPQYATNAVPTTDAFKAGSLEAASEMRDAIDDAYREKGVKNVQPFRVKEKSWIDLRDRIELRQTQADEMGQPSLWRAVTSHVGIPAAVIGSAFGTGIGFITGDPAMGAEAGGAIGALAGTTADYLHQRATNPNTQVERLSDLANKNPFAGRVEPTAVPPLPPGYDTSTPYVPPTPAVPGAPTAAAPTPRSPALIQPETAVDHQLHAALATYYGERIGQTSLENLQTRFTAELQLKALQKKPGVPFTELYTPEEKNLLGKINDSDAKAKIAAQEKHEELLAASQKEADQALTKARSEADKQEAEASAKAVADEEKLNPKGGMMEPGSGPLIPIEPVGSYSMKANQPLMDVPNRPAGFSNQAVLEHELGHHAVGAFEGLRATDIASHLHPDMTDSGPNAGGVAGIGWKDKPYISDENAAEKYTPAELLQNSKKWLAAYMGGAAANEVISGIPVENNPGLKGDIRMAKNVLVASGIVNPAEQDALIREGFNRAKTHLTKPGVSDIIKANAEVREENLDPELHVSAGRLLKIAEQGGYDADAGDNEPNGQGGQKAQEGRPGKVGSDKSADAEGRSKTDDGKTENRSQTGREELSPEAKKLIAEMPPNGGREPVKAADISPEAAEIIRNQPPNGQMMNVTKAESGEEDPFEKAVKHYGTTEDVKKAGYIGPDGRMLVQKGENAPATSTNYQQSTEFVPTPASVNAFKTWPVTGPTNAQGMIKPGNIDLTKRPIVHHKDGSVSSLYSGSFPLSELTGKDSDKGEVLVPFVSQEGKMMTAKEAAAYARKTGQTLGVFKTAADADAYAQMLHLQQGAFQTWKNGGKYNPTIETYDNWVDKH